MGICCAYDRKPCGWRSSLEDISNVRHNPWLGLHQRSRKRHMDRNGELGIRGLGMSEERLAEEDAING